MRNRRTENDLKKKIPLYEKRPLKLDSEKLHWDILTKLNNIRKPQAYLTERLIISRSTLFRISKNKEITLNTFLKLVGWLDKYVRTYLK